MIIREKLVAVEGAFEERGEKEISCISISITASLLRSYYPRITTIYKYKYH